MSAFGGKADIAYGSSKAAINLLTKVWAAEYGPSGVRVNAVSPGPTRTEGTDALGEGLERLAAEVPAGRPATADEIAEAIVFSGDGPRQFHPWRETRGRWRQNRRLGMRTTRPRSSDWGSPLLTRYSPPNRVRFWSAAPWNSADDGQINERSRCETFTSSKKILRRRAAPR